jgi:Macrocin-O-methyltransferase (TylF)
MNFKRRLLHIAADAAYATTRLLAPAAYAQDGLISVHTHDFMQNPRFLKAYARGVKALGGTDRYVWHWRAHIGLWAADQAGRLDGDFIECGVNYGFLSSAIMEWLDWNTLNKRFYLLDTFSGLDPRYVTASEATGDAMTKNREHLEDGFYVSGVESVQRNFAEWPSARIIQGTVPETLAQVDSERIAFAHIDMNCAPPEIAAAEFIWPRMVPGAMMLFDDYAYFGFGEQHSAIDAMAQRLGVTVCTLPTGQGLLVKPGR